MPPLTLSKPLPGTVPPLCLMVPNSPERPFLDVLSAAQQGEQEAVNELFSTFYPRVREIVHRSLESDLRRGRDWLSARFSTGDVVQEVFWSVISDLGAFGGKTEQAFTGYLAMVVRNRIIDAIRHHEAEMRDGRRGIRGIDEAVLSSGSATPLEQALIEEGAERYRAALEEFPERERLLLRARFEETATFEELADQLGYSHEASARRAYYGALARLTVTLKAQADRDEA